MSKFPADVDTEKSATEFKRWVNIMIDGVLTSQFECRDWPENRILQYRPPKSPEMKELTIKLGKFYLKTRNAFEHVGAQQEFGNNKTCRALKNLYLDMSLVYLDE